MAIVTSGFFRHRCMTEVQHWAVCCLGSKLLLFQNSKERMLNFKLNYVHFVKTTRFRWLTLTCDRRVSRQGFPEFPDKQGRRNLRLYRLNGNHNRLLPYSSLKERKAQVSRLQACRRSNLSSVFFTNFLVSFCLHIVSVSLHSLNNSEQRLHRVPGYHVMQVASSTWQIPRCPRLNGLTLLVELNKISVQMEGLVRITDILRQKLALFPTQVDLRDFDW